MNGPLRVLLVTDARSSSWTSACLLAGALPIERHRVTVAVVGPAPDANARAELTQLAPHAALAVLEGRHEAEPDAWTARSENGTGTAAQELRARLLLLCERLRPDIVHTMQLSLGKLAWDGPRVVTAIDDLLAWSRATGKVAGDAARYRAEVESGLAAASVVVAPSATMARELERHYKLADGVRVIRHGVGAASRAASERGLVALACGSLDDPAQQLGLLVAIAGRLPGPVGVAGESPARALPKPLVNLGRPTRNELLAHMAGAKVFLGLSRYDPTGLRVAEAQAAGARLVLLDTPSHRELFSGQADLVHDAESLATALRKALAAPRLARPATPRHSIAQTAQAYARLYEELLEGRQQQRAA